MRKRCLSPPAPEVALKAAEKPQKLLKAPLQKLRVGVRMCGPSQPAWLSSQPAWRSLQTQGMRKRCLFPRAVRQQTATLPGLTSLSAKGMRKRCLSPLAVPQVRHHSLRSQMALAET